MKDNKKTRLKKQILSGGIYIALAAAVVGVTTSTVAKLISGNEITVPQAQNTKYATDSKDNISLPDIPELPEINLNYNGDSSVSGTQDGISAETKAQNDTELLEAPAETQENPENLDVLTPTAPIPQQTQADFGYSGYVKPCGGLITKEYSDDVLVYSPTMYDYRAHLGVDIASEVGTPVKAVSGGIVKEVYNDDMYGTTVTIECPDGLTLKYCNLSQQLPRTIVPDAVVKTGDTIGGIGQTALCEAAEAPHLHLEAYRDGECFDPTELLDEASKAEEAAALSSVAID